LVKAFTRLPRRVSKAFAATLNAATRPFHVVNYLGSLGGARVLGHTRMERLMDFVIGRLQRSVIAASEDSLNRGMHFPVGWDPYFNDYMTLLHDTSRCLPLRHPALRPPPTPTHSGSDDQSRRESSSTQRPQVVRNSAEPAADRIPVKRPAGAPTALSVFVHSRTRRREQVFMRIFREIRDEASE
jgi:hypothetical protein